jgi:hypothetical protein
MHMAAAKNEHNVRAAWTGGTGQLFQSLSRQPEIMI